MPRRRFPSCIIYLTTEERKPRCLCGRIRLETGGGAWCPAKKVSADVVEYLQIDLGRLNVITHVETQGRFGNGQVSAGCRCAHMMIHTHVSSTIYYGRPPAMLAAGYSVLPLSFRSFFFRRKISEVAWPIVTNLCHVFDGDW